MAFKPGRVLSDKFPDDKDDLSDEIRRSSGFKGMTVDEYNMLLPKDFTICPPQSILPPIQPLLHLQTTEQERKRASIELVLKKIRARAAAMGSARDWNDVKLHKSQLQDLFITAEKGINENRASMSRFYEIIKENKRHQKVLSNEIEVTRQRIEDYRNIHEKFTYYVGKYSIFERFLENVAGVDDSWRNVRDVLNRYETLQSTSLGCARILKNELEQADELRKKMLSLLESKSATLKSLSNRLILLEIERKDAHDKRVYWEHMVQRIKYTVLDKTQEAISLSEGISDLYLNMCMRLKVAPTIPTNNIQKMMDFIHKNIMFYREVVTIASSGLKSPPAVNVPESKTKSKVKKRNKP